MGVKLFDRSSRSVRVTHAGATFLGEARRVLAAAQHAEQQVRQAHRGMIGTLRIGMISAAANARLAGQLRNYRAAFPEVNLSLHELTSSVQRDQLLDEHLDIGLLRSPVDDPALCSRFLSEAPVVLAVPANHRLAKAENIRWKDFDGEPLVMVHPTLQHGYYDRFLARCAEAGARPAVGQYAHDVQTVHLAGLRRTRHFLHHPNRSGRSHPARGLVFRPLATRRPQRFAPSLVWKRTNTSPPFTTSATLRRRAAKDKGA